MAIDDRGSILRGYNAQKINESIGALVWAIQSRGVVLINILVGVACEVQPTII